MAKGARQYPGGREEAASPIQPELPWMDERGDAELHAEVVPVEQDAAAGWRAAVTSSSTWSPGDSGRKRAFLSFTIVAPELSKELE